MKTLIKNGTVVTASDTFRGDVLIEEERIAALGTSIDASADQEIDAQDRLVIPGGVDVHTHLDMPMGQATSADDFESGTIAAAMGGTTCIVDFANQFRGDSMKTAFETWIEKAEGKAVIDYGLHMIMSEWSESLSEEMADMVDAGITSFKLFMAYPDRLMMNDADILRAMKRAAGLGATIMMHAENGGMIEVLIEEAIERGELSVANHPKTRPALSESEAVHRAAALARVAGVNLYIVHLSSAEALSELARARKKGLSIYAETCPQYLLLNDDAYNAEPHEAAKYVMSPPLRSEARQGELWRGLGNGELRAVATDHCPFTNAEKSAGYTDFTKMPNGAAGIETRLSLLYTHGVLRGRLSPNRWVEVCCTEPAKMFGLYGRKGSLVPGGDGDVVVFDPKREWVSSAKTLHMKVDNNPYEGMTLQGKTETVLSRGEVIVADGKFVGQPGAGNYVKRGKSVFG